jgi:tRNA(adenine34) deaminase
MRKEKPSFKNEDEEREFWSKHDSTDFIDWKKGERAKLPSFEQSTNINNEDRFMKVAIEQAKIAEENGDVPIGAVIVHNNTIIAKAYNQREQLKDPTAHAEIIALTQAAAYLENWHLNGCTIYVTLEPCPMCAGALVLSRMDRLVYGCDDPKTGAVKSLYNIVQDGRLNHRLEVTSGVLADECSQQLQEFFKRRRTENLE